MYIAYINPPPFNPKDKKIIISTLILYNYIYKNKK